MSTTIMLFGGPIQGVWNRSDHSALLIPAEINIFGHRYRRGNSMRRYEYFVSDPDALPMDDIERARRTLDSINSQDRDVS